MQMDFWQFARNADIHIVPGKLGKIYLHAWLFSNPRGKVFCLLKSMGQICSLDLILLRTCPHGLENNHACIWFFWQFSRNNTYPDLRVQHILIKHTAHYKSTIIAQSHCQHFPYHPPSLVQCHFCQHMQYQPLPKNTF